MTVEPPAENSLCTPPRREQRPAAVLFDKNDYNLLEIVNDVLDRESDSQVLRSLLAEHMHPQGIKELAAPRGLRIAYAIASLLGTFRKGTANDRIKALRSLRDEVFLSPTIPLRKNTARVLVQIMKELLRSRDNRLRQLKLAHDFRMVSTGNPRLVRAQLARFHLLEMPEEWNQFSFDDRVHDAYTKGRKTPTHLIMDAWIKGIRNLTVVYYNFVTSEVIEELIEASAILDIRVQVGIELSARFRDKYVRFTWEPHGFSHNQAFLKFLQEEAVSRLMEQGQAVSRYQHQYVFAVLAAFNNRHLSELKSELGISLNPLSQESFIEFVGSGQPSLLHLARFIYQGLLPEIRQRINGLQQQCAEDQGGDNESPRQVLNRLRAITVETIIEHYLTPCRNPEVPDPSRPSDGPEVPGLLRLTPKELINRLMTLHTSSRFTLNLGNLSVQDTLEILYAGEGRISHIEIYNLKDAAHGIITDTAADCRYTSGVAVDLTSPDRYYRLIGGLQKALNEDNVIGLKRAIRDIIWDYEDRRMSLRKSIDRLPVHRPLRQRLETEYELGAKRKQDLLDILYDLETFHAYYTKRTLGSRIGSSSTGQAEHQHGMGLVVLETLPVRSRKVALAEVARKARSLLPVTARLTKNTHFPCHDPGMPGRPPSCRSRLNRLLTIRNGSWQDWTLDGFTVHPGQDGNIATLGGSSQVAASNGKNGPTSVDQGITGHWSYLNTHLKNSLKVLIGFIPAFLTFWLTKDWWLLAYFGAVIWFGITGLRNIIQSVLGGGGLRRSPLLPWNSLVSWSRIADSLLYTGFSVPLLDFLVKTVVLDRTFGITTATNPILLYTVMGVANGIYISSHNTFRGLPRSAAIGNFFRSILAIPLAVLFNMVFGQAMHLFGVIDVAGELQKWAAIISKLASDCVAAAIEGMADRQVNIKARLAAYRSKISQLFAVFSRLDLMYPEEDVLDIMQTPKMMLETLNYEAREQGALLIVNALDLMHFWLYQPRARKALLHLAEGMTREEWLIFYRSQLVLRRYKEISQFFIDGLVGKDFSRALSFYLDRYETYLHDLEKIDAKRPYS